MTTIADTGQEALRILRKIDTKFQDGSNKTGSGFVGKVAGTVITCAHLVKESGTTLKEVRVEGVIAEVLSVDDAVDLACIKTNDTVTSSSGDPRQLVPGDALMFSGYPTGVAGPSIFSGMLSAQGPGLLKTPKCRLLQINGMINLGNSGGPVFKVGTRDVVGVITAKYVPLLQEIDGLRQFLRQVPQYPSDVVIGSIDFSKFVNTITRALLSVSGSLMLVQVGIGYAVPIDLWKETPCT